MRRTVNARATSFDARSQAHWSVVADKPQGSILKHYHHHYADDEGYACVSGRQTWHGMSLFGFSGFIGSIVFEGETAERTPKPIPVEHHSDFGNEVNDYCLKQGISGDLVEILKLAKQFFEIIGKASVAIEVDPEDGDRYIGINIKVDGTVDDIFEANERYLEHASEKFAPLIMSQIRLLYDIESAAQNTP